MEDRRLNRLVFWSVVLLDYALSFGVGRQTTFRVEEITQSLPTEEDIRPNGSGDSPRSPFPFTARQMLLYGPLINILNGCRGEMLAVEKELQLVRVKAMKEYNHLAADMTWNVAKYVSKGVLADISLQRHCRGNQGSIFLHLHLWMHTIIVSGAPTLASIAHCSPRNS